MDKKMNIRTVIEEQRKKLNHMVEHAESLTELLEEAGKMDLLIETYENQSTIS